MKPPLLYGLRTDTSILKRYNRIMSDIEAIIVIVIVACVGKYILKGVFGFHSRSDYKPDK